MTISLCMIIKDEQSVLENCLSSFKDVVDEIIIVDTGSSDNSKQIAKKYTDKIYDYKWDNNFSNARNYSISKANCEYYMWVDADDYLMDVEKHKLLKLKENNYNVDMYYFLYNFDKNYEPFYRERLIKNDGNHLFKGNIHEAIVPSGIIEYKDIIITQYDKKKGLTNRNINIFLSMDDKTFTSRDKYYFAKELYRHSQFDKSIYYFEKFLNDIDTYYIDCIDACFCLSSLYIKNENYEKALNVLFKSFVYDLPKANILCQIGNVYMFINDYNKAIYYYKLALKCKNDNKSFIHKDYFYYIPCINLCVCYDRLKKYQLAYYYNELAHKYKKDEKVYLSNKKYLIEKIK